MSEDWRIKVSAKVTKPAYIPWTGQEVPAGSIVNVVSVVNLPKKRELILPVPSMTALYISTSKKAWDNYHEIRKRNKIDSSIKQKIRFQSESDAFDALENLAISIISAYTAIETFCNDAIPLDHEYWHYKRSDLIVEKSNKDEIERYLSTEKKLLEILPKIFSVDSPKGKSPVWVSFKKLKKCRDGLIHAKSKETGSVDTNEQNLWDYLFKLEKPYLLAKDVIDWYFKDYEIPPKWYEHFPR